MQDGQSLTEDVTPKMTACERRNHDQRATIKLTLLLEKGRNAEGESTVSFRGALRLEEDVMVRLVVGSVVALFLVSPVIAGPCTQQIADLEKSISAKQEGAGPALAAPATTGSTTSGSSSTQKVEQPSGTGMVQTQGSSEAMNMLKQAKELDQQGKEAECMQITTRVSSMAPQATK